jgi:phospholipid/cholesterol/gamma-HCH transport system substrate-binding protein
MIESSSTLTRRIFGISFFLVVALFVWFTIAMYNKSFKEVVKVELVTDSVGNALPQYADVKMRGVLVGEVRSAEPDGAQVKSVLALEPGEVEQIPSNVTARLLPKTLFGERYVDLVVPEDPSGEPIAAGDTITQDASGNAVEVSRLLDSVLPLLQAVPPQDLSTTLGALAQALDGRGEQLGITIDRLETIFREVNTEMPNLQSALRDFATFTETYADAAPQLVSALNNLRTTNATIVERRPQIDTLLASLTATAPTVTDFLVANRDNIVSIAADSKETLSLLATYSPSFPCTFANFAQLKPRIDELMGQGTPHTGPHVSIELVNPRGRYLPNQDEPRHLDTRGPWCTPEPPLGVDPGQYPGGSINDGSYQPPTRNPGPEPTRYPVPQFKAMPATVVGSPLERASLGAVYGAATGLAPQDIPAWTTAIGAPALRGKEVSVR